MSLGRSVVRSIVIRLVVPNALLLVAVVAAAIYHRNWGWLGVGGTIITAYGALAMASRLLRLGPVQADNELPPVTINQNQFNWNYVTERIQREADNWTALVGLWVTLAGTIVAGALPFTLDAFLPF